MKAISSIKKTTKSKVYVLDITHNDFSFTADEKIEKIVGRICDGSGAGFGVRDMHFYMKNKEKAIAAFDKIKALKSRYLKTVRLMTLKEWEN